MTNRLGKPKVLFIIPGSPEGNSMIFSKRQAGELAAQGADVHVHYLSSRTNPIYLFKELFRLRALVKSMKPDVVHAHYGTVTSFLASWAGAKHLVVTFHGSDLNFVKSEFFLKELFAKLLSQLSVLRASAVLCVSNRLLEKLWWRKGIARVLPFGVDTNNYYPIAQEEARERVGFSQEVEFILFNNSAAVKRFDMAQAAVQVLKEEGRPIELVALSGGVTYERMLLLLNACNCLLICSDSEGSPVMVKEAMACNLPVVATDVGDVASVIGGSQPMAVADQQSEALANALRKVLMEKGRSNGREVIIAKELNSDRIAERLMMVYSEIMNARHT
jgi:glycosyltransferase involved in cell wall biosynthesis